jgi:TolB-like protein/Flp pilus assembly protein TadD
VTERPSFFTELKRRNVIRAAVLYGGAAWALAQGIAQLTPVVNAPEWAARWFLVAACIGFPFWLAFAWFYEWTPEGFKREREVEVHESITHHTGRKLDFAIIGVLSLAVVLLLTDRFVLRRGVNQEADIAISEQSIAVLPFVNMSSDPDNEYFADGITEEILNVLAQTDSLRVAGRTSSFAFKGKGEDLRQIGTRLGVAYIVEGSVRKSGTHVRISAQLIKVDDGFNLWSKSFNRELTDIFAVQDEIAGAVLAALKPTVVAEAPKVAATADMEAYIRYLQGASLLAKRGVVNLRSAITEFESALSLDPNYVPAHVGLARTLALLPAYMGGPGISRAPEMYTRALASARLALELDTDNAAALSVQGLVYLQYEWRWQDAKDVLEHAFTLAPNDAEVVNFVGDYYRAVRDPVRAVAMERRALDLDPLHPVNHWDLAYAYVSNGDCRNALVYARSAQELAPEQIAPYQIMVWCYGELREFDRMQLAIAEARRQTKELEPEYLILEAWAEIAKGDRSAALELQSRLERFAEAGTLSSALLGYNYVLLGESASAARWLQHAYEVRDFNLVFPGPIDFWRIDADPLARKVLTYPGLRELFGAQKRNSKLPDVTVPR